MAATGYTGGDETFFLPAESSKEKPNYNIVGNNSCKMVFKIPVGNIPDEEIEDYVKKVAEKFKKVTQIQPDLDCGIYNDNELFLPTNIEKKMPEQPDLQKIHDALYPKSSAAHYMHVIPNSHFWTDLKQIAYSIVDELQRQKYESEKHPEDEYTVKYVGEHLTKDYILIGLGNSLTHGYKLKQMFGATLTPEHYVIFDSIESMIDYVESDKFNLNDFGNIINNTLGFNYNLTNGIKNGKRTCLQTY